MGSDTGASWLSRSCGGPGSGNPSSAFKPTFGDPNVERAFQQNFNLTLALRDPLTPFDRANLQINANNQVQDPPFQIITFPLSAGQRILRIAKGRQLDKMTDSSGRTLRDSTAVGAGAVSRAEIDKMRNVNVMVEPGTTDQDGNGLGNIVFKSAGNPSAPQQAPHKQAAVAKKSSPHKAQDKASMQTVTPPIMPTPTKDSSGTVGFAALMATMGVALTMRGLRTRKQRRKKQQK